MNELQRYLEASGLHDGDRLPPERDLAEELGVSRRVLRQQLLKLELDGLIWRRVGKGTFLGSKPSVAMTGIGVDQSQLSPHIALDARLAFEPVIAAAAASRVTPRELSFLENCVRRNAEASDDESWSRWDGAFHLAIAGATRNAITIALAETLIAARRRTAWGDIRRATVDADLRKQSAQDHRRILAALHRRDPIAAAQAMRTHLQNIGRMLKIEILVEDVETTTQ